MVQAANAEQALRIMEERNDVGLLFTDVRMPGSMDGMELAWMVRQKWPEVQILVTSGYVIKPTDLPPGARLCPKPCSDQQVIEAITDLLAEAERDPDWLRLGRK